jgi:hypothetical protein
MHNLPPSWTQAAAGGPTVQRRRCLRRACSARPAFLAVAASHGPPSDPLAEDADEAELEPATDPFLDLPWWTLSRLISGAKRETPSPTPARMSSEEADDNHDLATILRRALMDLAAALQEIEQQLMSIPEDGAAPTRG